MVSEGEQKARDSETQELIVVKTFYRIKDNLEHLITLGIDEADIKPLIAKITELLKRYRGY